jgi:hypothetical protein
MDTGRGERDAAMWGGSAKHGGWITRRGRGWDAAMRGGMDNKGGVNQEKVRGQKDNKTEIFLKIFAYMQNFS